MLIERIKTKTINDNIFDLYREFDDKYVIYVYKNISEIQKKLKIGVFKEREEAIKHFEELK